MGQGLQRVNHRSRLMEWGQRVEACRNSGQRVSEWCEGHGIPVSTYYNWQRKVFQAMSLENEVCFAEVPGRQISANRLLAKLGGTIKIADTSNQGEAESKAFSAIAVPLREDTKPFHKTDSVFNKDTFA